MNRTDQKYKVLCVDDFSDNLNLLKDLLCLQDLIVETALSGAEALSIIEEINPDLVLLDIAMPEMNGFEVCSRIKNNPNTKGIPVIFLTALVEIEDVVKGFEIGAVDYITKPFNISELIARVFTHLELKRSKEDLQKYIKIVETKNQHITDSINYAERIQKAILPSQSHMDEFLQESFVLFKPRDVVSGDFYWMKQIHNQILIAGADCTGHGVPGAIMSMLGMSMLNEMSRRNESIESDILLNDVRKEIKTSLRQNDTKDSPKDGMDLALCVINMDTMELQFSGANRPLYIIRDGELQEYKGDRMPIAVYRKEKPFMKHEIQLEANDMIYMFSDGYVDQVGGERRDKFKSKRFKELLLENHDKSVKEQKEIFDNTLKDWQGSYKQIDDILIIGIRIQEAYGSVDLF